MHPTPAVGGAPKEAALQLIRRLEGWDRGWYAGPLGWVDPQGNGAFAVALRSGVMRGREAHLFAGCGIVGASRPEEEYREWQIKWRPMLAALEEASR
ncbi:MAG TPA: chorismate-binding protein, partial [Limnochorda sp.]